ncbi:MAG: Rpn family recombination-promoting nuclease/putative transposase [Candidatus Competibacter sp.]
MSVPHPHDVFVRDFLADLDQARAFFRLLLPPAFQTEFDLDTLAAEPTSLIDETLNELQSDLLFSLTTRSGEPRQLYLLFEHKSYLDPGLLAQLLGYLGRLYGKQPVRTPILPLVLYHGAASFTLPLRFGDEFALTAAQQALLRPYLPDFGYLLYDLSDWQPPTEPPLAIQVFIEALRNAASGDPERTRRLLELAVGLYGERNGARIVHALLTYLFHVTPLAPDAVRGLLTHSRPELENAMLTAAQQLYERGHREGEAKLLREQLEYKFGALPKRIQQRLAEADEADLRTWSLRLLSAATLDEVFPKTPRRRPPA